MMQCPKCKDFVDDERNAFCPNCGTLLAAPEPVPQPVPQEEQPAPETPETAQPPVQEPPVQQPAPPVYQFVQPGQPFPQPPQGVQQIVYVCQPAPRPKNGGDHRFRIRNACAERNAYGVSDVHTSVCALWGF